VGADSVLERSREYMDITKPASRVAKEQPSIQDNQLLKQRGSNGFIVFLFYNVIKHPWLIVVDGWRAPS
jgi:hypothetical protein